MTYEESIASIEKKLDEALMEAVALKNEQTGTQRFSELSLLINSLVNANNKALNISHRLRTADIMKERK